MLKMPGKAKVQLQLTLVLVKWDTGVFMSNHLMEAPDIFIQRLPVVGISLISPVECKNPKAEMEFQASLPTVPE